MDNNNNVIKRYSKYKINPYCFTCIKRISKKIYPLLKGSFYDKFKFLNILYDILRCFMDYNFNIKEAFNYLINIKLYSLPEKIICEFYNEIRKIIYKYYII